eukprot:12105965-Alexandrium_andersonii.AAC.1
MSASLVGSEMCIRDRLCTAPCCAELHHAALLHTALLCTAPQCRALHCIACLLYTSDAADDM